MKTLSFFKSKSFYFFIQFLIFLGCCIRVYRLDQNPVGLHQDEISTLIEAKALVETGQDRWGNKYPVYFMSWGSGANVLSSYLAMPIVNVFGLSVFSARLLQAIIGILGIIVFYFFVAFLTTKQWGLLSALFLTYNPWHFQISRWGLEENSMPFFLLLGVYLLLRALKYQFTSPLKNYLLNKLDVFGQYISLSIIFIGFYAYGMAVVFVPVLLLIILVLFRESIMANLKKWLVVSATGSIVIFPFFLFLVKNHILKTNMRFLDFLPFSVPLLKRTRLSEVGGADLGHVLPVNWDFLKAAFNDTLDFNTLPPFGNIPTVILLFTCTFSIYFFYKNFPFKTFDQKAALVPAIWVLCTFLEFLIVPANVNRVNGIYFPILLTFCAGLYLFVSKTKFEWLFPTLFVFWMCYSIVYVKHYFEVFPAVMKANRQSPLIDETKDAFKALDKAKDGPALVTSQFTLNYIYFLFFNNYPIQDFQKEVEVDEQQTALKVKDWYFSPTKLKQDSISSFSFMVLLKETPCQNENITYQNAYWKVGTCSAD